MEEKFIRNRIYSIIAKRKPDAIINPWIIDDYLANMAALIYPYVRDNDIDQVERLEFFVNSIKVFCRGKKKDLIKSLNEESLIRVLKKEWIPRLDDKIKLAMSLPIVESVNEDGHVIFKEKNFNTNLIINVPYAQQKYGNVEFDYPILEEVPSEKSKLVSHKTISITRPSRTPKTQRQPHSEAELDLIRFWEENHLPTTLDKGEFFWQTTINQETYEELKEKLILLDFKKNPNLYLRYAFQIAFFLAQWFMREYDGFMCERGLDQLGIPSTKSKLLWKKAKLPDIYLINSGQNEWLFSIYILGGFPIKYITRVKRFDTLFESIWTIRKDEEFDEETLDNISEQFDSSNSVYYTSLKKGGSLYSYINRIVDNDYPLAESDKKKDPYLSFCNLLDEGKRKCFDNFFKPEWRFYTDEYLDDVETELKVQIGYKNNRCYIPYDCVKSWKNLGDVSSIKDFILGLENDGGEKSRRTIRFSKTGEGKSPFVGWGQMSALFMDVDISTMNKAYVVVYFIDDESLMNGKRIHTIERRNHYQVFQTTDSYCWSTNTNHSAGSALVFTPSKYKVDDEKKEIFDIIPSNTDKMGWCWARIYDNITLEDTNQKTLHFYAHKGKLGVRFKGHSGIWMNSQHEVEYSFYQGDEKKTITVPILFGVNGIREVKYYPFEHDKEVMKLVAKDYKVQFKQDEWNYQPLTKECQPRCGLIDLRISDDIHSKTFKCFYLPDDTIFIRRIADKKIIFTSKALPLWILNKDGDFQQVDDDFIYVDNYIDRREDYIPFRIGTSKEYITIKVARPDDCKDIFFNGHFLTQLDSKREMVEIPLIMKDRFDIRIIDENGVKRITLNDTTMLDFHFMGADGRYIERKNRVEDMGVCFYLYKDKHRLQNNILDISNKQKDNYDFFFWSMEEEENPIRINCTYDIAKKQLTVPTYIFEIRNGIIFQSLRNFTPPHYVRPFYSKEVPWKILMQQTYNIEKCLKSFEIASTHNVYYSQFPPLYKMITESYNTIEEVIALAINYMRRQQSFTRKQASYLHRFANEFLFDWMLLPRQIWENQSNYDDRKNIDLLFRSSPYAQNQRERAYLDAIVNMYWSLPSTTSWRFKRSSHSANIALRLMKGDDNDFFFFNRRRRIGVYEIMNIDRLIKLLKDFRSSDTFYQYLYRLIQEKIVKTI